MRTPILRLFIFLNVAIGSLGAAELPAVTDLGFHAHADFTSRELLAFLRAQHQAKSLQAQVLLLSCGRQDLEPAPGETAPRVSLAEYTEALPAIVAEARAVSREIVWLNQLPGRDAKTTDRYNQAAGEVMRKAGITVIDLNEFGRLQPPALYSASGEFTKEGEQKRDDFVRESVEQWWTACARSNAGLVYQSLWPEGQLPPRFEDRGADRVNGRARIDHVSIPTIVRYPSPQKPRVALIVFPGGGYTYIGFPGTVPELTERLAPEGICVIGLKYRTGRGADVAVLDAARAVRLVRFHAREWGIDPHRIGITGQSAGAHLVWTLCDRFTAGDPASADPVERESSRPDFAAPLTTWGNGSKTSKFVLAGDLPPFFIRQAKDDLGFPLVQEIVGQLAKVNATFDVRYLDTGGHGAFRLSPATTTGNNWPTEFVPWLRKIRILP